MQPLNMIFLERANSLSMVGTRQVKFSDFNLVPPKKIWQSDSGKRRIRYRIPS